MLEFLILYAKTGAILFLIAQLIIFRYGDDRPHSASEIFQEILWIGIFWPVAVGYLLWRPFKK